jgi:RND family efflux transporter MFP subunit
MAIRTRLQNILFAGFVITSLATSIDGCARSEGAGAKSPPKASVAQVITLHEVNSPDEYSATGTVRALYNATMSSKVMGRVVSVSAREGDSVKKGQVLVSLDPRELEANVQVAEASYRSGVVGVGNAQTAAAMEAKTSAAQIADALAQVDQAKASLATAKANRDLVVAGPRPEEVNQSHLAVIQAESSLKLAKTELDRTSKLVDMGALARRDLDLAQNKYDVAQGQYQIVVQSEKIAREGSRTQEIQAAQEAVVQAGAAVKQAQVRVMQARAASLQTEVKKGEIESAKAQASQSLASVQSARVGLSYAWVSAPFDGRVVQRQVDPGAMASPGVPLIAIEGGEYRLEASVPENVLVSVTQGSIVPIQIDALGTRQLSGRVAEIVPEASAASHSFVVKFTLPPTAGVRSGMFGRAEIQVGSTKRILIPNAATWEREGLHYVFTLNKDNIARLRIVTLGEARGDQIEALSGLNNGDRIVASDPSQVSDGETIEANRS